MSSYASPLASQPDPNDPNNPYLLQMPQTGQYGGFSPATSSAGTGYAYSPYSGSGNGLNGPGGNGNPDTSTMQNSVFSGNEADVNPNAPMQDIVAANRDTINTTGNIIGQEAGNELNYYGALGTNEQQAQDQALNQLEQTPGYSDSQLAAINGANTQYGQALTAAQQNFNPLNTAVNNPNLQVSNRDVNNIVTAAGTTVGNQFGAAEDALRQQAAAQGNTSPAAEAAMRRQLVTQEAATAGDTMTQAQIQARQYQLGALQQQTGLQATADTTEEAAAQSAANTYGQFNTGLQQQEAQQAITGQSNYRSGVAGQQSLAQSGQQGALGEQNQAYSTQTSGANSSAAALQNYDTGKDSTSMGAQAAKSIGAGVGTALGFAKGGTADEDQIAKVAESGPELIVNNRGRYKSNRRAEDEDGMFRVAA